MKVGEARSAAVDWVVKQAVGTEGFRGAFFSGSTIGMPDEAELATGSDLDVVVIRTQVDPSRKPGKFEHRGALLEVTHLPWAQFASADEVLSSYHLAGSFRDYTIIADPTGDLGRLQAEVSRRFAEAFWVQRRCLNARQKVEHGLTNIDASLPWHDQVTSWLFPTGVTTHVLLVAALRNPTIRLRYLMAREVLHEYGRAEVYPKLLRLLGASEMTPERVEHHLAGLTRTFDMAAAVAQTAFFFSSDITPLARRVAVDASHELVARGFHREAVFWIVATYARCQKILATDAPRAARRAHVAAFDEILADLGIRSTADLLARSTAVLNFLPKLWETTEFILSANPEISRT